MTQADARRGVLDTSTIIVLERISDTSTLPHEPLITAVTLAELSVGPLVAVDPGEQAVRQARLQQAEADFDPLPFDAAAAGPLVVSPPPCTAQVVRPRPVPTTQ
jgi:tRNA(fMet)-specific endonuclease VapC